MTTLEIPTISAPTVRPDPPVVVLFGCPGAGKGTLADILVSRYAFAHLSTGAAMRAWADGPSDEQIALKAAMARGDYGSDDLAARIVRDTIAGLAPDIAAVILDGFPRNRAQYDVWRAGGGSGLGVLLELGEDVAIARIHDRGTCPIDGTPVAGATADCPHCGTPATRRVDDCEVDTIRRRFAAYRSSVLPIVDAWQRDGLELVRFDARGPIEALEPFASELASRILA